MSMEFTIGTHRKEDSAYLDACRAKRNMVEYDNIGGASRAEAQELLDFTKELKIEVMQILREKYPDLVP